MKFQVVTRVPDPMDLDDVVGNAAIVVPLYIDRRLDGTLQLVGLDEGALNFRAAVFDLGEVVIVDDDGREIVGACRKADKWDVSVETFDTIDAAVARAQEVAR